MDMIGWFIATLHSLIGHEKTAVVVGQPAGDTAACVLCQFERGDASLAVICAVEKVPVA